MRHSSRRQYTSTYYDWTSCRHHRRDYCNRFDPNLHKLEHIIILCYFVIFYPHFLMTSRTLFTASWSRTVTEFLI